MARRKAGDRATVASHSGNSVGLQQCFDWFSVIRGKCHGTEFGAEFVGGVEAQTGEERGKQIRDCDSVADDLKARFIRLTDDNAAFDRSAAKDDGSCIRKVITAVV